MSRNFHEDLSPRTAIDPGSSRTFGFVFTGVFAIVALWPLFSGNPPRLWAAAVASAFLLIGLFAPRALGPLNRLWFRFGMLLNAVISPIVMAAIFFLAVTPTAIILRIFGKDPLRLKRAPDASSYWIRRTPAGPDPETMKNQF